MKFSAEMSEFESRVSKNLAAGQKIPKSAFIASGAQLSGHVILGEDVSIWHGAVLRGDIEPVIVGDRTNIQDNAVLHNADGLPCNVGKGCTIGHSAIIHACTISDECLIGMGAVILDGSQIGSQCLIGAKSLVTQNSKIPSGSLVYGSPAKVIRPLTEDEKQTLRISAERYVRTAKLHRNLILSKQ
jgi:carbonic anhydrase/acetyltransferase-like protein (isoleucine patch superfamily)